MESPENSSPEKDDHDEPAAKRSCKNNARRFTDEQIRSLESIFKVETKLEPRKKVEIARDLGLEPRQVAIWFQNRRARWKSKQIEQEYKVLRANYDSLSMQFDELKKEKQSLQMQLKELTDLVKNANDHKVNTSTERDGELKELYPNSSTERLIMEHNNDFINTYESGDAKISKYFEKREDQELLSWGEEEEEEEMSHLASPETWCNLIDQSSGTSTWCYEKNIVEVDSEVVFNLVSKSDITDHPLELIVRDCRHLLHKPCQCNFQHTRGDGNVCADALAKLGHSIDNVCMFWVEPPPEVIVCILHEELYV